MLTVVCRSFIALILGLGVPLPLRANDVAVPTFIVGTDAEADSATACRQTCETYFVKNPDARPASMKDVCTNEGWSQAMAQVSPIACANGAWEGVLTLPQKIKAYGMMVESAGTYIRENVKAHQAFIAQCDRDIECRVAQARELPQYSAKKANGEWYVSDKEVRAFASQKDIMTLLMQVDTARSGMKAYCQSVASDVTREVQRQGLMSFEFAQARYMGIAKKEPQCLGVMKLMPPEPVAEKPSPPYQSWSDWFTEKGIQLQCYPPGKISELVCYRVADFVADPLIVGGGAGLVGKIGGKAILAAGVRAGEKTVAKVAGGYQTRAMIRKLEERVLTVEGTPYKVVRGDTYDGKVIDVLNAQGERSHTLYYRTEGRTLHVDNMDTYERKGTGIARLAMGQMLKSETRAKSIKASMAADNLKVAKDAMAAGADCISALKKTPFYKSSAALGFGRFISANCPDSGHFELELGR